MRVSSNMQNSRAPNYPRFGAYKPAPRPLAPGKKVGRPISVAETRKREAFIKTMGDIRKRLMTSLFGDTTTKEAVAADKAIGEVFARITPTNVETPHLRLPVGAPRSRLLGKA